MKQNYLNTRNFCLASALAAALLLPQVPAQAAADLAPLPLKLPEPTLKGTPEDLPRGPHIEQYSDKPRAPFMAPKGIQNVAMGKKVTGSEKPFTGSLDMLTDGKKEAYDDQTIEIKRGKQWLQVDLGDPYAIYAIVMWHDHRWLQVYRDVVVQVADDPDFTQNVRTIFNNDVDNSAGLGIGTDKEYFETREGKLIDAKGVQGRYVRTYVKGSSLSALNCFQELEVYGLPAK